MLVSRAYLQSSTLRLSHLLGPLHRVICTPVPVPSVSSSFDPSLDVLLNDLLLDGLSVSGNGPKIFKRTNKSGVPLTAIIVNSTGAFLAFMSLSGGSNVVFGYFKNLVRGSLLFGKLCLS